MPNRIIKESICANEQINQLSAFDETFFYRLIVNADDYGRMDGRTAILRARLFPLRDVRDKQIEDALHALATVELVNLYTVHGKPFVSLSGWERNQSIRAKKSKYPAPEEADECTASPSSADTCMQMHADASKCPRNPIQSESESESESKKNARSKRFTPPSVNDVSVYCAEQGYHIDPQRFVDYYESNGWMVGKNRMKDWRATVRTWASRDSSGIPAAVHNPALSYAQRKDADYSNKAIDLNALAQELSEEGSV